MNNMPVAIVGMSCRFPGANSVNDFWDNLRAGVDSISEVPDSRWNTDSYFSSKGVLGKSKTKWGGFISDVDEFDSEFFGISPREAETLDPQQRLLLEVAYEALEDASLTQSVLDGLRVGVFVGGFTLEYMMMQLGGMSFEGVTPHTATGSMMTLLANRLSYVFDFNGPSVTVDTACSSGLTAVHLAMNALAQGDCDIAIVGGVNVILSPAYMVAESQAGMLSPTGQSHPFDLSANGYVRGEGAGVVVLMPQGQVQEHRQTIYATILASGVNQDGASDGITVPSGEAQSLLTRTTLERAGVRPTDVVFVEAHGTGTPVGDPIEANALGRVLGADRLTPCLMSSVKANIGHLEAAAGIAGLIKAVLQLYHGEMVPHLHLSEVNPAIDLDRLNLAIPTSVTALRSEDRFAVVNSFGFGGANAQVVLERAAVKDSPDTVAVKSPVLLPLSAKTPEALEARAKQLAEFIGASERPIEEIAGQLALGRDHHMVRWTCSASRREQVIEALLGFQAADAVRMDPHSRLAFVYSGMGPQWNGMGRELYATESVFRKVIDDIGSYCENILSWHLTDAFTGGLDDEQMAQTLYAQPANFALQVGLTELLKSWGIIPTAVCGHSAGEPAAAYAAGALSLEDATLVSISRSITQQRMAGQGRLLAIGCSHQQVMDILSGWQRDNRIETAAINSPSSCALVGPEKELSALSEHLDGLEIFNRLVPGTIPYHSSWMEPLEPEIKQRLDGIKPKSTTIPMMSTVTGELIDGTMLNAEYWYNNVRQPVRFESAVAGLLDLGCDVLLEISPHPALGRSIVETIAEHTHASGRTTAVLRREMPERECLLEALGELYRWGVPIGWDALYGTSGFRGSLPPYAWQHARYWRESEASARRLSKRPHPFVIRDDDEHSCVWELDLLADDLAWLQDHRIEHEVVFPAAGYVELAMWAAQKVYGNLGRLTFRDVEFERALYLDPGNPGSVRLSLDRESGWFSVSSRQQGIQVQHAAGRIVLSVPVSPVPVEPVPDLVGEMMDADTAYRELSQLGLNYGPAFRALTSVSRSDGRTVARAKLPLEVIDDLARYTWHPVLTDVAFQTLALASNKVADGRTFMPVAVTEGGVSGNLPAEVMIYATVSDGDNSDEIRGDITLTDLEGHQLMRISGCRARDVRAGTGAYPVDYVGMEWIPQESSGHPSVEVPSCIVLGASETAMRLELELRSRGCHVDRHEENWDGRWLKVNNAGTEPGLVIDARSLDAWDGVNPAVRATELGMEGLKLFQMLSRDHNSHAARVWTVTRGAQHVASGHTDLVGSTLWGLGRVIGQFEMPGCHGGLIDIDDSPQNIACVADEILGSYGEDQVAFRKGDRWILRMKRTPLQSLSMPPLREDAAYLISGGLGALGLVTARWMVEHGARHLVLIGRSGLPDRSEWSQSDDPRVRAVMALESAGASVEVYPCDVADADAVKYLVSKRQSTNRPPIKGIIHAAGTSVPQLAVDMTETDFRSIVRPKAIGAWNLDRTFATGLDFFIMYSSVASLIVSPGQANYAAGNAFLDALAYERRERGEHGLSVNWGPWGDVGMATQLDLMSFFERRGLYPTTSRQGVDALKLALVNDLTQVAPIAPDWERTVTTYPGGHAPAMLEEFAESKQQTEAASGVSLRESIAMAPTSERSERIRIGVSDIVSSVLRYESDRLRGDVPLTSMGMDSMLGIELKAQIESALGIDVSIVSLLKGMTLEGLAESVSSSLSLDSSDAVDPEVEALLRETANVDITTLMES